MKVRLPLAMLAALLTVAGASAAQPTPIALQEAIPEPSKPQPTLTALPQGFAFTRLIMGDWEKEDELTGQAYEDLDNAAEKHNLTLGKRHIVIYEVIGLKTFRKRIGYLLDTAPRVRGILGKGITLEKLPAVKAWMTSDKGDGDVLVKARRRVFNEVWKTGVKRLDGIEVIEIYHGDPSEDETPFDVYAPLAQKK